MEAPEISEEEIRKQIMEEFEAREKIKIAQLEEEIKRAEQEKHEEIRGKKHQNQEPKKKKLNFFADNRAYRGRIENHSEITRVHGIC